MIFTPVIPAGGLVGWSFLNRTQEAQKEVLQQSPQYQREAAYFRENIGNITTAEQLVSDPILFRMSLTAFGLQGDLNNKFFIQKVLEDGTVDSDALANRLADKRYQELSDAFGFGPGDLLRTGFSSFTEEILARALNQEFEQAVGDQDPDLRVAVGFADALSGIVDDTSSDTAKWFGVLGTPPVRTVFEAALGLPQSIGSLDIDKQLETFRERASAVFGTSKLNELGTPERQEELIRKFLLQSQIGSTGFASSSANALSLLQAAG